jgi:peptidoglycan lytic transglycosylase
MRWGVAVAMTLVGTITGCGLFSKPKPIASTPGATQEGIASWYGPGFHGRRTANGEIYNQYGLTAAHQTLPHGTRVRVTNLTNNRDVLVRINDRGPFVDDRIIDLSYSAARQVEMIGPGTAPVRIEVVDPGYREPVEIAAAPPPLVAVPTPRIVAVPPARRAAVAPPPRAELPPVPRPQSPRRADVKETAPTAARYAVQIGAFDDYQRARRTQRSLESQGARAKLALVEEGGMRYYRLRIGPFAQQNDALRTVERVNALGYPALIVADRAVWQ